MERSRETSSDVQSSKKILDLSTPGRPQVSGDQLTSSRSSGSGVCSYIHAHSAATRPDGVPIFPRRVPVASDPQCRGERSDSNPAGTDMWCSTPSRHHPRRQRQEPYPNQKLPTLSDHHQSIHDTSSGFLNLNQKQLWPAPSKSKFGLYVIQCSLKKDWSGGIFVIFHFVYGSPNTCTLVNLL